MDRPLVLTKSDCGRFRNCDADRGRDRLNRGELKLPRARSKSGNTRKDDCARKRRFAAYDENAPARFLVVV
jgi:hypothetical protein